MAVTIGASCAFLTPIGLQSNMLIMSPGVIKSVTTGVGDYRTISGVCCLWSGRWADDLHWNTQQWVKDGHE